MKKTFCDECGRDMTNEGLIYWADEPPRTGAFLDKFKVHSGDKYSYSPPDMCWDCIAKLIRRRLFERSKHIDNHNI